MDKKEMDLKLFESLIEEIKVRRLGYSTVTVTSDFISKLESETEISKGALEGYFGIDRTKSKRVPRSYGRDTLARLDNAYKDYNDYLVNHAKKSYSSVSDDSVNIEETIRRYYITSNFSKETVLNDELQSTGKSILNSSLYTDISYFKRDTFRPQNDFFIIEKEGLSYRRLSKARSEIFTNYFSVSTITELLVMKQSETVLIGNPGIGKTTYAKWICLKWADKKLKVDKIPIYIPCKSVIEQSEYPIISYIKKVFGFSEIVRLFDFISQNAGRILFVFDAFDEASLEQRITIEKEARFFSSKWTQFNYVILSRPHALIESDFQKCPNIYELIGFNEINRAKFIRAYVEESASAFTSSHIISFIDSHGILRDLSYNPLYLTYIVTIATTYSGLQKLKMVKTSYDLHSLAFSKTVTYNSRYKSIGRSKYLEELKSCISFIAELEVNLSFVYHSKSISDANFIHAEKLSSLGIGRIEDNPINNKWNYYTLNIHFQEFLTANYFGPFITKEALLYLLSNPKYWYLSRMLIGFLVANNRLNILKETIFFLKDRGYGKLNHEHRLYFSILGELPSSVLNETIVDRDLDALIEFSRWLQNDYFWNIIYQNALQEVYSKLNAQLRQYFDDVVYMYIENGINVPQFRESSYSADEIAQFTVPVFIIKIIDTLKLYQIKRLAICLLKKYIELELLSQKYYSYIERLSVKETPSILHFQAEEAIDDSRIELLQILGKISERDVFLPFETILFEAMDMSVIHSDSIARIVAKTMKISFFLKECNQIISKKTISNDYVIKLSLLIVCSVFHDDFESHTLEVIRIINSFKDIIAKKKNLSKKIANIVKGHIAFAISQTDKIELYPILVWANDNSNIGHYYMENLSYERYSSELRCKISSIVTSDYELKLLLELEPFILSSDIGHISLESQYDDFLTLFKNAYNKYSSTIGFDSKKHIVNKFCYLEPPFASWLYRIPDMINHPTQLKIFFNDVLEMSNENDLFMWDHYLLFLLSCDIPFHEDRYWDLIFRAIDKPRADVSLVFQILYSNDSIYLYEKNADNLGALWGILSKRLLTMKDHSFFTNAYSEILVSCYKAYKYDVDLKGISDSNRNIVSYIYDIVSMPILKGNLYSDMSMYHREDVFSLIIYPILCFQTEDKTLFDSDRFYALIKTQEVEKQISFYKEFSDFVGDRLIDYRDILGDQLYQNILKYSMLSSVEHNSFSVEAFKALLSNNQC